MSMSMSQMLREKRANAMPDSISGEVASRTETQVDVGEKFRGFRELRYVRPAAGLQGRL